jgi:hypothetical protein
LGLEIAPKVRFMKKGQKQEEQTSDPDTKTSIETNDNNKNIEEEEDDDDDNWFTVKKKPDALEQVTIDLPKPLDKQTKLTKAKLAKKLRKKNLLINKRIEYDDEGNVSIIIIIIVLIYLLIIFLIQRIIHSDDEDQSVTYNIEEAKARLHHMDKTDKEAYRALVKQKHKVCIQNRID